MSRQVTTDQHFVPRFYMKGFAHDGSIQVLHLRKRRIGRPKPYGRVCYQPFFYGQKTGVQDELSQEFESLFGWFETQFAQRFPAIIENARNKRLSAGNLDTLAYMMALQWIRGPHFREMVGDIESQVRKFMFQTRAQGPKFIATAKEIYTQHDIDLSDEQAQNLQRYILEGNYEIKSDNTAHLKFMLSKEHLEDIKLWFLAKQWNVLFACGQYRFVTSDNPVAEWLPRTNPLFGSHFVQRKHYFPLSPDIMIESVRPTRDPKKTQHSVETVEYHDCNDVDTLVCDMVMAHHAKDFIYARSKEEFTELLRQQHQSGEAMEKFTTNYLLPH